MSRNAVHVLLNDLIALQSHLHGVVDRQLRSRELEAHWDAKAFLDRLAPRLLSNVEALKQDLERRGDRESALKERIGSLTGVAAGWLDRARSGYEITRDLRDDYAFLSLVIVSYGVLNAAAAAQDDDETADVACEHLDALSSLLNELMVVLPEVALREFAPASEDS